MSKRTFIYLAWIGIIVLAMYLRFHDLGLRPMHADEATGARIAARQLETGEYIFNPVHFHGPTLAYSTIALSWFTGEKSWQDLEAGSLRFIAAIAGLLIVMVPMLWIRWLGHGPTLAAAALLSTSPILVYNSRMYIHENLLAAAGLLALTLAILGWVRQKRSYWIAAGICLGLMAATKETFVISLIAWSLSIPVCYLILRKQFDSNNLTRQSWIRPLCWMLATGAIVAVLLYTNGLKHPKAVIDVIQTFFVYKTESGHDKPIWYYIHLLLIPKGGLRLVWWEGAIALLALPGLISAFRKGKSNLDIEKRFLILSLAASVIFHFLIYSLIGYKTPWLMVFPWIQACLLAGMAFQVTPGYSRNWTTGMLVVLVIGLTLNSRQSLAVSGRFANDQRNPYAYVPTSGDVPRLEKWLDDLEIKVGPLEPLGVVGKYYWPLPWYLRSFDSIGYWDNIEDSMTRMSVLFVMPAHFENANSVLKSTHVALPRGLRQDSPMMLYLRQDLWDKWMGEENQ